MTYNTLQHSEHNYKSEISEILKDCTILDRMYEFDRYNDL